jgi:hypothetical protein
MSGEWQACAVCGYPLEELGGEWLHARNLFGMTDDHVVIPVDMSSIEFKQRCDFCYTESVTHFAVCDTFVLPFPGLPQTSHGPWALCQPCHDLFVRQSLGPLITRVMDVTRPIVRSRRRDLVELYEMVKQHTFQVITFQEWVDRGRPMAQAPD